MGNSGDNDRPAVAADAVLVPSDEMPADAQRVEELDFDKIKGPITADDLLQGMKYMGFQATAVADAVRIINEMVKFISKDFLY
jgi:deoxyhypusine synthase